MELYCSLMLVVGVSSGLALFIMNYMFAYSGEKLTQRIRNLTFQKLLTQVRSADLHPDTGAFFGGA